MTIDEIKKWMLESSGFPVTQANAEYLERFQAIAFRAGAASRDAEVAKWNTAYTSAAEAAFRLSLERDQLRTEMNEWRGQAHRSQSDAYRLKEENDRLRAQINAQREALNVALWFIPDHPIQPENKRRVEIVKKALSSTPEQSLAEYRNKVIEECAAVLNVAITRLSSCGASIKNDVAISTLKEQSCRLRAMKEQP